MVVDARDKFHARAVATAVDTYKKVGHFETKERLPQLSSKEMINLHFEAMKRIKPKGK